MGAPPTAGVASRQPLAAAESTLADVVPVFPPGSRRGRPFPSGEAASLHRSGILREQRVGRERPKDKQAWVVRSNRETGTPDCAVLWHDRVSHRMRHLSPGSGREHRGTDGHLFDHPQNGRQDVTERSTTPRRSGSWSPVAA